MPPVKSGLRRAWHSFLGAPHTEATDILWRDVRARHPRFVAAVLADARVTAASRGDRYEFTSRVDAAVQAVRLAVVTDAFLALCCYRAKAHCQARRIPVLPRVLHRLAMITGQISIGDPVVVQPGIYVPHGQVVVDGMVEIGERVVLSPFVTIGLARRRRARTNHRVARLDRDGGEDPRPDPNRHPGSSRRECRRARRCSGSCDGCRDSGSHHCVTAFSRTLSQRPSPAQSRSGRRAGRFRPAGCARDPG